MLVDAISSLGALLRTTDRGAEVEADGDPVRLDGGRSADLFRVRLCAGPSDLLNRDLVLRVGSKDRADLVGVQIQREASALGYPTPRVLRIGVDDLSRACSLMEWADGSPLFDALGPLRAAREAPGRLAELMVALHDLDPASVNIPVENGVLDVVSRAMVDIERRLAATESDAGQALLDWLAGHRPPSTPDVICHGDLHALNVLAGVGDDVVVDWELSGFGPREFDVTRTKLLLEAVPFAVPAPARPIVQRLGRRAARHFESSYQEAASIDEQALPWFEALHCTRISALVSADHDGSSAVLEGWRPTLPFLRRRVRHHSGVQLPRA